MLLDDSASEVTIVRYIDLTSEEQKSVGLYPLGTANQSAGFVLLQLLRSLSHRFVQFTIREGLANVTEDGAFFSGDSDAFKGPDLEKFRTKEGDVCIVCDAGSVVCTVGEGIGLAHAPHCLVVEGEVEAGQVERPSGLAAVELLGGPEVLEVLMVHPDLKRLARAFQVVSPLFQRLDDCVRGLTRRTLRRTLRLRIPPYILFILLSFYFHFTCSYLLSPSGRIPLRTLRVLSVGPSMSYPSDPIIFIRSPSGLYSIIVRYLFILFPEPSTACPRVRPVYIRLLNTCYGFPQINSLWIPLTGQLPFPQYYI